MRSSTVHQVSPGYNMLAVPVNSSDYVDQSGIELGSTERSSSPAVISSCLKRPSDGSHISWASRIGANYSRISGQIRDHLSSTTLMKTSLRRLSSVQRFFMTPTKSLQIRVRRKAISIGSIPRAFLLERRSVTLIGA